MSAWRATQSITFYLDQSFFQVRLWKWRQSIINRSVCLSASWSSVIHWVIVQSVSQSVSQSVVQAIVTLSVSRSIRLPSVLSVSWLSVTPLVINQSARRSSVSQPVSQAIINLSVSRSSLSQFNTQLRSSFNDSTDGLHSVIQLPIGQSVVSQLGILPTVRHPVILSATYLVCQWINRPINGGGGGGGWNETFELHNKSWVMGSWSWSKWANLGPVISVKRGWSSPILGRLALWTVR